MYLEGRVRDPDRAKVICRFIPQMVKWSKQPGLNAKTLSRFCVGSRGPHTQTIFCHFPRIISKELDQGWNTHALNQYQYELQVAP